MDTKKTIFKSLKSRYESACNDLLKEFCHKHNFDFENCFWVAESVGGIAVINDYYFVNMQDIICDFEFEPVEELKDERTFEAWFDYTTRCGDINPDMITPNLKSWKMGCWICSEKKLQELERNNAKIE